MELGWRQGAILDQQLALLARDHAPDRLDPADEEHLVVASHDCDILNASLTKEPVVEVLRARVPDARAGQRSHHSAGRNPRALRLSEVVVRGDAIALDCGRLVRCVAAVGHWLAPPGSIREKQVQAGLRLRHCVGVGGTAVVLDLSVCQPPVSLGATIP